MISLSYNMGLFKFDKHNNYKCISECYQYGGFICEVKLEELFKANYKGLIYMSDYIREVYPPCRRQNFCDTMEELEETAFYQDAESLVVVNYRIVDTETNNTLWQGWEVRHR